MQYTLVIKKQAKKKLAGLANPLRVRIAEKIARLDQNPDDPRLDIKKLSDQH